MFFNADKKSSLDSSCDRNVSFSKVIWVSCTMIRLKSSVESNRPVDLMSVALQRPRTRERRHRELRKRLLNEELLSLPGPRKPKNREQILPTSFEPAMKPEYFFICGSSWSAQPTNSVERLLWRLFRTKIKENSQSLVIFHVLYKFGFSEFHIKTLCMKPTCTWVELSVKRRFGDGLTTWGIRKRTEGAGNFVFSRIISVFFTTKIRLGGKRVKNTFSSVLGRRRR